MIFFAPAKLNLYLHITGKRPDGYHLLDSLVAFTDIGDELSVEPADNFSLRIKGPFAKQLEDRESPENNLVTRMAKQAAALFQKPLNIQAILTKNLPLGAGLGGGSTDAAAMLRALLLHWKIEPDPNTLDELLLDLGTDLPACFKSTPLRMRGIGEKIQSVPPLPAPLFIVLAYPAKHSDTASVYRNLSSSFIPEIRMPKAFGTVQDFTGFLQSCGNDLTPGAIKGTPEISEALDAMERQPGALLTRMSGSGSSCFSLFEKEEAAQKAASNIARENPSWWVKQGRIAALTV